MESGSPRDELDERKSLYAWVCWQERCEWEFTLWRTGARELSLSLNLESLAYNGSSRLNTDVAL